MDENYGSRHRRLLAENGSQEVKILAKGMIKQIGRGGLRAIYVSLLK